MKKTSKILAVVLTLIMLLSTAPLFASAAGAVKPQAIKEASIYDGDELKIDKVVRVKVGDTVKFTKIAGAELTSAYYVGDNTQSVEINYNEDTYDDESVTAVEYGVAVITVFGYKEISYVEDGETYYDYEVISEYTWAVVVVDPDGMGEVTGIEAPDMTFRYKEGGYEMYARPYVETANDDIAYYTTVYVSMAYDDCIVYENGSVYTGYPTSNDCTVYVVDAAGHVFKDTCTITVKYTWWQWLIRIILLGFLWY